MGPSDRSVETGSKERLWVLEHQWGGWLPGALGELGKWLRAEDIGTQELRMVQETSIPILALSHLLMGSQFPTCSEPQFPSCVSSQDSPYPMLWKPLLPLLPDCGPRQHWASLRVFLRPRQAPGPSGLGALGRAKQGLGRMNVWNEECME